MSQNFNRKRKFGHYNKRGGNNNKKGGNNNNNQSNDGGSDDEPEQKTENRPTWLRKETDERHTGSYPLEDIQKSADFERRIVQSDNAVKKKYAACFSYLGSNYQGLQINPFAKTIEAELERALFLAGGIIESNYGFMHKVQWTRSARTDRGVHALSQCCAMKLVFPENGKQEFINQVNSFLPADIRIQALTKVSKGFNAKALCTRRRYHYLLPTFSVKDINVTNEMLLNRYKEQGAVQGAGYESGYVDPNTSRSLTKESLASLRSKFTSYRIDHDSLEKLRSGLKAFEGTHNFHNFTSGKEASEANAKRYIISFECGEPYISETTGVEYVLISVLGQSFLLNQIRKMIHFAIEIARGGANMEQLQVAFSESKVDIPMAPAVGLYLDELFFDGYNIKMRREQENDKRILQNRKNASSVVIAESDPTANEAAEENKEQSAEKDEDGDDPNSREEVDWYAEVDTKAKLEEFRNQVLHPHIMKEVSSL